MKKVIKKDIRNKAFIGAAIGAVGNIVGGLIGGAKKRRAEKARIENEQKEQNKSDTFQAAQAMSSGIADQSYADEYAKKVTLKMGGENKYKDRINRTKKKSNLVYKYGGRRKAELGDQTKDIALSILKGVESGVNSYNSNSVSSTNTSSVESTTTDNISRNRNIAANQQMNREQNNINIKKNTIDNKNIISNTAKYGTKRKKSNMGSEITDAAGGVGSMIGSLFASSKAPTTLKKENGFTTSAPKIGIQKADFQNNINSEDNNTTNSINTDNTTQNNQFVDRNKQLRCGGKKTVKRKK